MMKFLMLIATVCVMQMTSVASAEEHKAVIAVIVSSNQNVDDLNFTPNQLSLIYWRKQLYWPKGLRIKPVNLSTEHPLRLQFSQAILGSAPKAQIDYWNGQYFNGVLPPYSVNSEEAVLRYVSQTKGAIGYVDACTIDERVNTLFWITISGNIVSSIPSLDCRK